MTDFEPLPARTARRGLRLCALVGLLAAAPFAAGQASAQAIERNLPPAPTAEAPQIVPPNAVPSSQDATPIGPPLRAIVLLGAKDDILASAADGVDVSRDHRLASDGKAFARFLGHPISRQLIAEVEAEIARRYRARGFPFVSVSTPQQPITAGVVQIRVIEFHLGAKTAPGASAKDAPYIESRVRVEPGEAIDAGQIAQDLDWLNRDPFRRTEAVFTPGAELGATDLQLRTTESKPWSVYAGYADSGSPLTGLDRYFAGAQALLPGLHDALVSYQFTGSSDALFNGGVPFDSAADPRYLSHAARLTVPTLARQAIEVSFSYVRSNEPDQAFVIQSTTYEGAIDYRSALSDLWSPLPGEGAIGVEVKHQDSRILFGDQAITNAGFDVVQLTVNYAQQEVDVLGHTSGEVTVHVSPGSVDSANTPAVLASASQGRVDTATYAYVSGDVRRTTRLPALFGVGGWTLANALVGQYSAAPLPITEQMGLGDDSLVRGYTLDDGAFDTALVSRNELRAPAMSVVGRAGGPPDQLSPFAFIDAGYGKIERAGKDAAPVSTGLGADYQLGAHFSASLDGAWALRSVGATRQGGARIETRVTVTF